MMPESAPYRLTAAEIAALPLLPDQVALPHDPQGFLGHFLRVADQAARDRGIHLRFCTDFDLLRQVNQLNLASWHGLAPSFDPAKGGINGQNGFWLMGHDADGAIVATQAARRFDLGAETLADYLESLRLFYPDPARQSQPGERCEAPAAARLISGRAVFSGSTWIHPHYRRRALPRILPRLSRSLALARWNTDVTFSMVSTALVAKGVAAAYGYDRIHPGIRWLDGAVATLYEGALVWMPRDELLQDLRRFALESAAAQVEGDGDIGLQQRTAG